MKPIYHITTASELRRHSAGGRYTPSSLGREGFVHCTATQATLLAVARDYFGGATEPLVLLAIEPALLSAELRYEAPAPIAGGGTAHLASGEAFPHVYGPIDLAAVSGAAALRRDGDAFLWPDAFGPLAGWLGTSEESSRRAGPQESSAERVERLNAFARDKHPGMVGAHVLVAEPDEVIGRLHVTAELVAGTGFLWAPVVITLADWLCAVGIGPSLPADASFTTIELKANFLGTVREGGAIRGRAVPVHRGRTTQVWDVTVADESNDKVIALFRCTQMVLHGRR